MFYIYADGKSIFQPMDNSLTLLAPKLTLEMGKAGSLSFQIPPTNRYYSALSQLTTMITVEMDDVEIFRGRVLTNSRNFNNIRTIYCEGDLAYLVDTVQKAERYYGKTHDLFRKIIEAHNKRADADKQFLVGDITIEDRDIILSGKSDQTTDEGTGEIDYKQIAINSIADEWQNTYDFIESCLINYTGGYLRTRRQNGVNYVDLLVDYGNTATQDIEFGKNLLDLTEEISAEDLFTVLIPLGDSNLTIESVNNGSDELVDEDAVQRYGRIVKTHVFDSVYTPETLLENGQRYLASNVNVPTTLTVKAVDLHLVDANASPIYVGDKVHVVSAPHGMTDELTCTKIEYDMENPANNTYTFGTPKQSLTERYRKDQKKQESSGSGGGSAGEAAAEEAEEQLKEFFDAWINVDASTANIDLGTLYKKYTDTIVTLESSCGISMDAPSGNVNIKTLRKDFDDMGVKLKEQSAYIDLLNNEQKASIALVTSQTQSLTDLEAKHYTELTSSANDQEAKIAANTESIKTLQGETTTSKTNIDQLSKDLQAQINLEATHQQTLQGQLTTTNANIEQIASDLNAQIELEATHNSDVGTKIASLELRASNTESSLTAKADKATLNSKVATINSNITNINGDITNINTEITNVKQLIADEISALKTDTVWLESNIGTINILKANKLRVSGDLLVGGLAVATESYVNARCTGFATQAWVEGKGYLTEIPTALTVNSVKATEGMSIGVEKVATQYWCMTTKKFATQEWVQEQLQNYAAASHSHSWSSITNKPSTFTPASHTHSFSGSTSISTGHTHTVKVGSTTYTSAGASKFKFNVTISGTTGKN